MIGRDHRIVPKNNQDAWYVARGPHSVCAVICDGCGSGAHSEVGAQLAARVLAKAVANVASNRGEDYEWPLLENLFLAPATTLAGYLAPAENIREVVEDYFLFTVLGVVLGPKYATFFGCGDGVFYVNGYRRDLGPYPDNSPPYLGYQMLRGRTDFDEGALHLTQYQRLPVEDVSDFLIGCDGAGMEGGLSEACQMDWKLPGLDRVAGPISQFWGNDAIFSNPATVSRRLKLMARDWPPRDPEHGFLADDTTIVVGRRT